MRRARPGFILEGFVGLVLLIATAVLTVWLLFAGMNWLVGLAVDFVPPEYEEILATGTLDELAPKVVRDPLVQAELDAMVLRLKRGVPKDSPYTFRMRAVEDATENAYALPGGEMFITTGLIRAASSPDEVAGILGHEMQHVMGRHSLKAMGQKMGVQLVLLYFFGDGGLSATVAQGSTALVGLDFDRRQESESDRVGVGLAHAAGYDPSAMANFFERNRGGGSEVAERALALLSDHPADAARIANIRKLTQALSPRRQAPSRASVAQWRAMADRVGRLKGAKGP